MKIDERVNTGQKAAVHRRGPSRFVTSARRSYMVTCSATVSRTNL